MVKQKAASTKRNTRRNAIKDPVSASKTITAAIASQKTKGKAAPAKKAPARNRAATAKAENTKLKKKASAIKISRKPAAKAPKASGQKQQIAVVGAGMMGRGIAACIASGGYNVTLYDNNTASLPEAVMAVEALRDYLKLNNIPKGVRSKGAVSFAKTIKEAVSNVDFAFEVVFEDTALKQKVFREIEKYCPKTAVICSNTSALSITEISSGMKTQERCMSTHFIGPAHLVPLVEICPGKNTDRKYIPIVKRFLELCGKRPIVMKKEIDGFVAARLQAALYREAMHIQLEGAADAATIDQAVYDGFGRRLNQIGPFIQCDFAGTDLVLKTHARMFPTLGDQQYDVVGDKLVNKGNKCGVKNGEGHYKWPKEKLIEVSSRRDAELLRRLKEDPAPN